MKLVTSGHVLLLTSGYVQPFTQRARAGDPGSLAERRPIPRSHHLGQQERLPTYAQRDSVTGNLFSRRGKYGASRSESGDGTFKAVRYASVEVNVPSVGL